MTESASFASAVVLAAPSARMAALQVTAIVSFDIIVPNDSLLVGIDSDLDAIPQAYALGQNYPNPFNPTTTFVVSLPQASDVKVMIYNVLGQQVAVLQNGKMQAGEHKFTFDASQFASGMYFYRVEANNFRAVKKMLLVK